MSDSIVSHFNIKTLIRKIRRTGYRPPFKYKRTVTHNGPQGRTPKAITVVGLTKAKAHITAQYEGVRKVTGYEVSANLPSGTVDNNVVVHNCPTEALFASKYLLQRYLIEEGLPAKFVQTISTKHALFAGLDLTYCFMFATKEEAKAALDALSNHAEMVLDDGSNRQIQKVQRSGTTDFYTGYINNVDGKKVRSYIKVRPHRKEHFKVSDPIIAKELRELGARIVRVEIFLDKNYLEQNLLHQPEAWSSQEKVDALCRKELEWLRDILNIQTEYRTNDPQKRHCKKMDASDVAILNRHIAGENIYAERKAAGETWQYEPVRARILKAINVDISIPWAVQKTKAGSKGLSKWLRYENIFQPPEHLEPYCYTHKTAKQKNVELRALVKQMLN